MRRAAALYQIVFRVDFVGAVDCKVERTADFFAVQRKNGNAVFFAGDAGLKTRNDGFYAAQRSAVQKFGKAPHGNDCGRAGSQADFHTGSDKSFFHQAVDRRFSDKFFLFFLRQTAFLHSFCRAVTGVFIHIFLP